jgi:hypothetical protein
VSGSLIVTLSDTARSGSASASIPAVSVATTSALTSPSTIAQISASISVKSRFSFAASDGFVVTPASTPHDAISRISSTLALSMKSFMRVLPPDRPCCWGPGAQGVTGLPPLRIGRRSGSGSPSHRSAVSAGVR